MNPSSLHATAFPLVLGLGLTLLAGCGHKSEAPTAEAALPAAAVRVQTVETRKWPSTEEVIGTIRAKQRATIEAKVSGRISDLPVVLGQKVTKGQLLAQLDAAEIQARLEQAQAGLQQAERDWDRISSLFRQQAVTRAEYDAADARLQSAKAAVAEARAMVAYVKVLAPFDGVVTRKWVELGDLAAPGKPLLDIEDPSTMRLEADVPEAIATRIQQDARMDVRIDSVEAVFTGTVVEIAPTVDSTSRTFRVKLNISESVTPHSVRSGQFGRLIVPVGEEAGIRIPASAVIQRGQMEIVFAVANQRAGLHLVKTGRYIGDSVEILAGLAPAQSVVVEGAAQLTDGQPVEVK